MRLAKTPAVFVWALVWFLGVSGGVQGGVLTSVVVTPDPLRPGQDFTVQVKTSEECTGAVMVDLRPTATQVLRLALTFTADGSGGWVGVAQGTIPAGLNPAPGAVVSFLAVVNNVSGLQERATTTVGLQSPVVPPTLSVSPDPLAPGGGFTASLTSSEQFTGVLFVDLRPTSVQILRFTLSFTSNGAGSWTAQLQGTLPANLVPAPGAQVTFLVALTSSSGRTVRLTRMVALRGTPSDTTPPDVAILSPAEGSAFAATSVAVSGTTSADTASLKFNGVAATLAGDGTWAVTVPLVEGLNALIATATDGAGNVGTAQVVVRRDTTAPQLSVVSPADGAVVNDRQPVIQIAYADTGAGLDLTSFSLQVNAVDVTAATAVGSAGAQYTPASALPAGDNEVKTRIRDRVGNERNITTRFTVAVFRALPECVPSSGPAPLTVTLRTRGEFTGGSIVRYRWDFQNDGVWDTSDSVARDFTQTYSQPGAHVAVLEVQNNLGQVTTGSCTINVTGNPPEVYVQLLPSNGAVPLAATFLGYGRKPHGSIVKVEFDFEGDGTYDLALDQTVRPKPDAIRFYINHANCYGGGAQFSFFLNNQPIGTGNATVGCSCNSQEPMYEINDPDLLDPWDDKAGNTLKVSWSGYYSLYVAYIRVELVYSTQNAVYCMYDKATGGSCQTRDLCNAYDDDPFVATTSLDASERFDFAIPHTYAGEGTFNAVVRVTDNEGFTATASATATVIRVGPPGSPSVEATATPPSGNAPLNVTLGGTATDDGSIVLWEWDFEGDGSFDYSSATSPATTHQYTSSGLYVPTLRVTDNDGMSSMDTLDLNVGVAVTLSIVDATDSFNPSQSQTVPIKTTLSGGTRVRLFLRDSVGNVVKQLVDAERAAGTYSDSWDGTDSSGLTLPHGPYYAILEYRYGAETRVLDLTGSTGGTRYNPPRNSLSSQSTFRPYEDQHLTINFTVNQGASEILAFVGLFNTDTRFVTLLERVPFGSGSYQIKWDGLDANGTFAVPPSGDTFLFGIWGYKLPDNAVFLLAAPNILNVTVDPNFYDPSAALILSRSLPTATVKFDLDRTADVELTVTRLSNGRVLRRIRAPGAAPGTGLTMTWDGRADDGVFVDSGEYRLGLTAVGPDGSQSLTRYALVRVSY